MNTLQLKKGKMKNLKIVTVLAVIIAMQYIVTAPQAWALQAIDDKTLPVLYDSNLNRA